MKRLINRTLVVVMVLFATSALSNEMRFTSSGSGNYTLVQFDVMEKGSTLYIKDKEDEILYKERINQSGNYTKEFDLTKIPDANYYFEIKMHNELRIIPFVVKENIAEILKDSMYSFSKPELNIKGNHVYLTNNTQNLKNVEISIFYENDDLAYTENFKNVDELQRVFDFSSSLEGNYTIVMKQYGRMFNQSKVFYQDFMNE